MSIFKEPEYTIAMLGEGDVTFGSGLVMDEDSGKNLGHLPIDVGDAQPIGSFSDADPDKKEVGDFPISLTFGGGSGMSHAKIDLYLKALTILKHPTDKNVRMVVLKKLEEELNKM